MQWTPYQRYHVTFDVDVATHRYDVAVRDAGGTDRVIAHQFAFRTEQANVTALDHVGYLVDGSGGDIYVCDPTIAY